MEFVPLKDLDFDASAVRGEGATSQVNNGTFRGEECVVKSYVERSDEVALKNLETECMFLERIR